MARSSVIARPALVALTALSLASCEADPPCVERDVGAAERAFSACTLSKAGHSVFECRVAAEQVACKRWGAR